MREIKFRAWFTKKNWDDSDAKSRMVYFDSLGYCDEYNHLRFGLSKESRDPEGGDYSNLCAQIEDFSEMMQFTGLKDKNGQEIYEGDIVRRKEYHVPSLVEWDQEKTAFIQNHGTWKNDLLRHEEMEVLGNIYENPDLLTHPHERREEV